MKSLSKLQTLSNELHVLLINHLSIDIQLVQVRPACKHPADHFLNGNIRNHDGRHRCNLYETYSLVPGKGIEPPQYCYRQILSLVRLPVPSPGLSKRLKV